MKNQAVAFVVLLYVFFSAIPIYWAAKSYCKTNSVLRLYVIFFGAGILISIIFGIILSSMTQQEQIDNTTEN